MPTVREEVVNENLAQILEHYLRDVSAESIVFTAAGHQKKLPDVRVSIDGVTMMLEARFSSHRLAEDAIARIKQGLCDVAIALEYPAHLKEIAYSSQRLAEMRKTTYKVHIFHRDQTEFGGIKTQPLGEISASELAHKLQEAAPLAVTPEEVAGTVRRWVTPAMLECT